MNWVLLRGLGRERRHWFEFPDRLRAQPAFAGGEILALDLPGFGDESSTSSPISIRKNTEFLRARLQDQTKSSDKWGIIGISLGGMVAMDWAQHYPSDFSHLVLINASTRDLSPVHHRLSVYGMYRIIRATASRDLARKELEMLKMVSNLRYKDSALLDQLIEIAKSPKASPANLACQLTAAVRYQAPTSLAIPTLILASLKDAMVDVRCSKKLAERLSATIKFHPTAGHDLTLDDPAWASEKIEEFVHEVAQLTTASRTKH